MAIGWCSTLLQSLLDRTGTTKITMRVAIGRSRLTYLLLAAGTALVLYNAASFYGLAAQAAQR